MIIGYFNVHCFFVFPLEADTILVVYANAPLTTSVAAQPMKTVAAWRLQVARPSSGVDTIEQATGFVVQFYRKNRSSSFGIVAVPNVQRPTLPERHALL